MMGNPQEIIDLRRPARHVREFFSKKPLKQQLAGQEFSNKHLKELIASHNYLLIKSMSVLRMMSSYSFGKAPQTPKKKIESSSKSFPMKGRESMSKRIDGTLYGEGGLSRGRVHGWRFKESVLVKKQFQSLCEAHAFTKRHEIFPLLDGDPAQESLSQTQKWQDQLGYKEERQFLITRITKILSS